MESHSFSKEIETITPNCKYYTEEEFANNFSCIFEENNLSILHLNSRSLTKNVDKLTTFVTSIGSYNFTFIAVTETWLLDNSIPHHLHIPGYNIVLNSKIGRRGGGVAIYVRNKFH